MAKRTKKDKRRILLGSLIMSIIISYLGVFVYHYWNQILANKEEQKILEAKYEQLLKEEDELNNEITKMQEPDYVAKYAREKYGYSKENEVIIKVDDWYNTKIMLTSINGVVYGFDRVQFYIICSGS